MHYREMTDLNVKKGEVFYASEDVYVTMIYHH